MPSLSELLDAPSVRPLVLPLVESDAQAIVRSIALVEDLQRLDEAPPGAVVVLTAGASRDASSYRLDMALRVAASRGSVALILTDERPEIPTTAAAIAQRARVGLLVATPGSELTTILLALQRELAGGPDAALARIRDALDALLEDEQAGASPEELLRAAGAAIGSPLELRPATPEDIAAPIQVDDEVEGAVCTPRAGGHGEAAAEVVAYLAAAAVGRARGAARRAQEIPRRSREQLLVEFLLAHPDRGDRLLERMRAADLAVDGWHSVIWTEPHDVSSSRGASELASVQRTDRVGRIALEAAHAAGGVWHKAHVGSALLLVSMQREEPAARTGRDALAAAGHIVGRIVARMPDVMLICGVGSTHAGANGLRASAAEARAAVAAARAGRRVNAPVGFDEVGLRRTLMEWFASDVAREAVDTLLAPLDKLGPRKGPTAIETLQAYLDNQGSLARTAEQLHLHRNAVAYRIKRILEVVDVDLSDPDSRLMLQLACRARSIG